MQLDKQAILDSLTQDDVITILADLGANEYKQDRKTGALIFRTVCHGGDSHKLYYYHEATDKYPAKLFHCYTECSDSFNIIQLVIRAKRAQGITFTFYRALNYIAQLTGKMFSVDNIHEDTKPLRDDLAILRRIKKVQDNTVELAPIPAINENILDLFYYAPHEAWLNEGISEDTMEMFEVSYWAKCDCIVLPVRDYQGRLIGIRCRNLNPELIQHYAKYCPLVVENKQLSFPVSQTFYGICQNMSTIQRVKKVILYEGEKSVLLNHTYFPNNDFSLAVCGSNLSQEQIYILLKLLKVTEVIVAFDKEYQDAKTMTAGAYLQKLLKKVQPLLPYCTVNLVMDTENLLDMKDSPIDKGKDVLLKLMKQKIQVTPELIALVNAPTTIIEE